MWHFTSIQVYPLPLILTALLHVALQKLSISWHVPLLGHDDVAFLNDVANDAESTTKICNDPGLKSETMGKMINIIPGPCLLI